jgi:hypothetical protein
LTGLSPRGAWLRHGHENRLHSTKLRRGRGRLKGRTNPELGCKAAEEGAPQAETPQPRFAPERVRLLPPPTPELRHLQAENPRIDPVQGCGCRIRRGVSSGLTRYGDPRASRSPMDGQNLTKLPLDYELLACETQATGHFAEEIAGNQTIRREMERRMTPARTDVPRSRRGRRERPRAITYRERIENMACVQRGFEPVVVASVRRLRLNPNGPALQGDVIGSTEVIPTTGARPHRGSRAHAADIDRSAYSGL